MAITSVGYDGTIDEVQWAEMIKKVGASDYGVVGGGDWRVTGTAGVDRTVTIAAGKAWGHGVFDTLTSATTIQLDTVASGYRWDLVAIRRDWTGTGGASTIVKVNGTTTKGIPAARLTGPGVTDDQPLALVQITAGQSAPTAILDLRVFAGNGGMTARDEMVLTYLKQPGASLNINGTAWACTLDGNSNSVWTTSQISGKVPLFGVGGTPTGMPIPPSGTQFLIQAGSTVLTTDANGFAKITYPKPFPNGLLSVQVQNGNDYTFNDMGIAVAGANWGATPANKTYVACNIWGVRAGVRAKGWSARSVRLNWIAIGW